MSREIVVRRNGKVVQAGADGPGETIGRLKKAAERSLYVFAKQILNWKDLTPTLHGDVCRFVQTVPPRRKGILMPRGTFKSTIALSLVMHLTIQRAEANIYLPGKLGRNLRILYCAETADQAEKRISYLKNEYESNQLLRALWPEVVWDEGGMNKSKPKWNQMRLCLPRTENYPESTIERTGVDTAITGGHFDILIKDDLISIEARNSEAVMKAAISWNNTSHSLANRIGELLEWYFGTRWGAWDLYADLQKRDPSVEFYIRHAIEEGRSIAPDILPMSELERLRSKDEDLFFLNYMNTTVGSKLTDFDMAKVRQFSILDDGQLIFEEIPDDERLSQQFTGSPRPAPELLPGNELFDEGVRPGDPLDPQRFRSLRGGRGVGLVLRFS